MKNRRVYVDILRIIAIVFVLFNHTNGLGFLLYQTTSNSIEYPLSLFFSVICKMAVPLFFMISGSLLLNKKESLKEVVIKRVLKYAMILSVASVLVTFVNSYLQNNSFEKSIREYIKVIWRGDIGTYWYLYAYLGLLLMLPVLRAAQNMKKNDFVYLISIQILFVAVLPTFMYIFLGYYMNLAVNVLILADSTFYFLMGFYLMEFSTEKYDRGRMLKEFILSVILIGLACVMVIYEKNISGEYSERYLTIFLTIPTLVLFKIVRNIVSRKEYKENEIKIISFIGNSVFIIYLSEPVFIKLLLPFKEYLANKMENLLAAFVLVIIKFCFGIVVATLLTVIRKGLIPFYRKLSPK